MALHLTVDTLRATYSMLQSMAPFRRWKLPHADEIEFHVVGHKGLFGDWFRTDGRHGIRVSAHKTTTANTLLAVMAHEMCHIRQYQLGARREQHGRVFERLADQVCKKLGFDRGAF